MPSDDSSPIDADTSKPAEPKKDRSSSANPGFLFVTCQRGAENAVKVELAGRWPDFRFAFSRPGFLTFKLPADHALTDDFALGSVLVRAYGFSLGKASGRTADERAKEVWRLAGARPYEALHVWQRGTSRSSDQGPTTATPEATAAEEAIRRHNTSAAIDAGLERQPSKTQDRRVGNAHQATLDDKQPVGNAHQATLDDKQPVGNAHQATLDDKQPVGNAHQATLDDKQPVGNAHQATLDDKQPVGNAHQATLDDKQPVGIAHQATLDDKQPVGNAHPTEAAEPTGVVDEIKPARRGQLVLDCIVVEGDEWWVGYHRANSRLSRWPGGIRPIAAPADRVSWAYLKIEEALRWSRLPMTAHQRVADLGCSPGGAAQALLNRGLIVTGIDPAEPDPRVAAHPNFTHLRKRAKDVRRREFRKIKWLVADINAAPDYTLTTVEQIVTHPEVNVRGLLLTLKISDWKLIQEVPQYIERVRAWGYEEVRAHQLPHFGQEICLAALRKRVSRNRQRRSTTNQKPAE